MIGTSVDFTQKVDVRYIPDRKNLWFASTLWAKRLTRSVGKECGLSVVEFRPVGSCPICDGDVRQKWIVPTGHGADRLAQRPGGDPKCSVDSRHVLNVGASARPPNSGTWSSGGAV